MRCVCAVGGWKDVLGKVRQNYGGNGDDIVLGEGAVCSDESWG